MQLARDMVIKVEDPVRQLLLPAGAQVDLATLSLPLQHGFHPPPAGRPSSDSCV
jgi:hypothetical protein